ncbi:MAG: hypothetical protein KAR83_07140 [Thermodesulfovibrionales bacterium]|nr:hypothetical protein [Thermodesulfovibrionales bacterium]
MLSPFSIQPTGDEAERPGSTSSAGPDGTEAERSSYAVPVGTEAERSGSKLLGWLFVFAVSMGFLEAIVVVYLRMLFFPDGFSFPLGMIPPGVLMTEIVREACTMGMLIAVAAVSARGFTRRLGAFLFVFGVWDIFYYVALKIFLGWPPSLLTWDVLFLIPVTWLGPVLAPLIVAVTMAGFGGWLMLKGEHVRIGPASWVVLCMGAFDIFCAFVSDYAVLIVKGGFLSDIFGLLSSPEFMELAAAYVPESFGWGLFAIGELMVLAGIWHVVSRDFSPPIS